MEPLYINFNYTKNDYSLITETEIEERYIHYLEEQPDISKIQMAELIVADIIDRIEDDAYCEHDAEDLEIDNHDYWELYEAVEMWIAERWDLDDHEVTYEDNGQILLFDPNNMPK